MTAQRVAYLFENIHPATAGNPLIIDSYGWYPEFSLQSDYFNEVIPVPLAWRRSAPAIGCSDPMPAMIPAMDLHLSSKNSGIHYLIFLQNVEGLSIF